MGNANPAVTEVADEVTGSHNEDGLAQGAGALVELAQRALARAPLALIAAAFLAYNIAHWWSAPGDDWSSIWVAAAMVAGSRTDLLYSVDPQRFTNVGDPATWLEFASRVGREGLGHPYVHEPGFAYAMSPFAGPGTWIVSLHVLLVLNVVAVLGTVWMVGRIWAPFLLEPVPFAVVLLVLSVSEPLRYGLWLGQTTPVILFLTVAAIALARRHPLLAGLVLAIPVSIKITPVLLGLWWLLDRRRWKALGALIGGLVVLSAVQLAFVDSSVIADFISAVRHVQQTTTTGFSNQSFPGWLVDFSVSEPPGTYPTQTIPGWISAVSTGCLLVTVAGVLLKASRLRRSGADAEHFATAGLLTAGLPFTPLSWTHYYLLLLVPAAVLLAAARRGSLHWPYLVVAAIIALNVQPLAVNGALNAATPDNIIRAQLFAGILAIIALFMLPDRVWRGRACDEVGAPPSRSPRTVSGQSAATLPTHGM